MRPTRRSSLTGLVATDWKNARSHPYRLSDHGLENHPSPYRLSDHGLENRALQPLPVERQSAGKTAPFSPYRLSSNGLENRAFQPLPVEQPPAGKPRPS